MPLIELKNIYFQYPKSKKNEFTFSLDDINLRIGRGQFISVAGQNGSGKSTLMKILAGILTPASGERILCGENYSGLSRRRIARKIAFVPQFSSSVFPYSVREIVMMGRTPYLNLFGIEKQTDTEITNAALEMVGIYHLRNKCINEVSGGEAQRAYIARAFAQDAETILLDEPNSHLDIKHQIAIFKLIKKLSADKKVTVVSILHDLNLAGYYSDRVILMKEGRIYSDAATVESLNSENIKNVFGVKSFVSGDAEGRFVSVTIRPEFG